MYTAIAIVVLIASLAGGLWFGKKYWAKLQAELTSPTKSRYESRDPNKPMEKIKEYVTFLLCGSACLAVMWPILLPLIAVAAVCWFTWQYLIKWMTK